MFSSVSGHHFAGHWDKGVPPPPPITSLRYSLQNGSGPLVNPSTGLTYLKNIDRVETDGGGDIYWDGTLPTVNTTTSPYNLKNAYRSPPSVLLYPGSLLLTNVQYHVVNFWFNLQAYLSPGFRDGFLTFLDVKGSGYWIYLKDNGAISALVTSNNINNAGPDSSTKLPLNQWKMITLYFRNASGGSIQIYIDGVLTDATTYQNGNMNNLSQMNLILNMGNVNSSISAKWNDFRMYMDNGVTPAQIYAAEKGYYLGSFSGGIDFTGQGQQGVFLQTSPLGSSTPSGTGMVASVSASHGNNGITANPGQVGVTPPYLFASDGSKNLFGGHAVPIDDTTLTHFSVWVNPVGTIPGGILMRHQYSPDVTITLSMTSTRQITGTVVKGGFTRTLSALGSSIPLNTWSMVSISVILANTEPCYLSVDGVAYSGGGATGGGVTMTNATFTVTMMGSPNLRFNQMIVHKQAWFTLPAMYEASKSSYGRV